MSKPVEPGAFCIIAYRSTVVLCSRERNLLALPCKEYTPSTRDTYPFPNPYLHVNTVKMSELIITSSAYIINGDSPMTSVANTVAMTTLAVHTLQPLIFYRTLLLYITLRHTVLLLVP